MPRIQVYKCNSTGKLFEDVQQYRKHLRQLATARRDARTRQARLDEVFVAIQGVRFIREMSDALCRIVPRYYHSYGIEGRITFTLDVRYIDMVSNTHHCPRGGITNWHGDKDKPRGYPGYRGNIRYSMSADMSADLYEAIDDNSCLGVDRLLGCLGVHTGFGGSGGGQHWAYDVKLFEADFPNLLDKTEAIIEDII